MNQSRALTQELRNLFFRALLNSGVTRLIDYVVPAKSLGRRGEREAERLLLRKGMFIVARGYSDLGAEIDLIAVDGRTVVFVEVKTRTSDAAGMPTDAVDEVKQQKIVRAATAFLHRHQLLDERARFDVVSIYWPNLRIRPQLTHYEHAFQ
jgi:putative endonuclease